MEFGVPTLAELVLMLAYVLIVIPLFTGEVGYWRSLAIGSLLHVLAVTTAVIIVGAYFLLEYLFG